MAIDSTTVIAYASELALVSVPKIDLYIDLAKSFVSESKWGTKYEKAVCLLAAHLLTVAGRSGSAGSIASESLGEMAVSYSNTTPPADSEYATTTYGQMFLMLRKTLGITPLVV